MTKLYSRMYDITISLSPLFILFLFLMKQSTIVECRSNDSLIFVTSGSTEYYFYFEMMTAHFIEYYSLKVSFEKNIMSMTKIVSLSFIIHDI